MVAALEEVLEGYDPIGNLVTRGPRNAVLNQIKDHSLNHGEAPYAVPLVHLFLLDSSLTKMYITQRSFRKEDPFLLDKAVKGHVAAGETSDSCLIREAQEEIGVTVKLVDSQSFPEEVLNADLNRYAVVRPLEVELWFGSYKWDRSPWTNTNPNDGNITLVDGEFIPASGEKLTALVREIIVNPQKYDPFLRYIRESEIRWLKREQAAVYFGFYEGPIIKQDDEVIQVSKEPIDTLFLDMTVNSHRYTDDFLRMSQRYAPFLRQLF